MWLWEPIEILQNLAIFSILQVLWIFTMGLKNSKGRHFFSQTPRDFIFGLKWPSYTYTYTKSQKKWYGTNLSPKMLIPEFRFPIWIGLILTRVNSLILVLVPVIILQRLEMVSCNLFVILLNLLKISCIFTKSAISINWLVDKISNLRKLVTGIKCQNQGRVKINN